MSRQKRSVSYRWQLRGLMAERGMFATTELVPLLVERGIELSVSQVHRLVTTTPERLSLPVLAALCDIFGLIPRRPDRLPPRTSPARPPPATAVRSSTCAGRTHPSVPRDAPAFAALAGRATALVDPRTPQARPPALGRPDLHADPVARAGLNRRHPWVPEYLRGLARGDVALTHEACTNWRRL